jgi:hypothetical protein
MVNAISDAEVGEQHAEVLPARTVLSMFCTSVRDRAGGSSGVSSTPGPDGESTHGSVTHGATPSFDWMAWLRPPGYDHSAADTTSGQH